MAFQRRCWAFQRAGWIVMVGLLGLTAVGLFSKGPLSWTTASSLSGAIAVHYERVLRLGAASTISIDLFGQSGATEVTVDPDFAKPLKLESVYPLPRASGTGPDGMHMLFEVAEGKGRIVMSVRPEAVGYADASLSVPGAGGIVQIPFFVFP